AANATKYIGPMTTMVHSQSYILSPPAGPAGESLYWASAVQILINLWTAAGAGLSWYSEVNYCVGGPTAFTDGCASGTNGQSTCHFATMLWKGVATIGCAFSHSVQPIVIICRYKAGDTLSLGTPNMNQASGNYKLHVFPAK
ncbi:MAG: CAP domain-containing protein, partial [Candidatus Fonsibacter sp.]